jgi:putative transcriptional regulator
MIKNSLKVLREQRMAQSDQPDEWTQEALARRVGVTRQTIISIEKGRYNPTLELAFKLANDLGLMIEDIFSWEEVDDGKDH